MSPLTFRLALVAASTLAAAGLGVFVIAPRLRTEPPPLMLIPSDEPLAPSEQGELEAKVPGVRIKAFEDTTLVRYDLPESALVKLYPQLRTPELVWQSQLGFRRPALLDRVYSWPEHPLGSWAMRTNEAGFRMDAPLDLSQRTFAIVGDSHLEGACSNNESVAGLITEALRQDDPELQVANLACGGYSLHQYLGALEFLCGDTPGELVDIERPVHLETLAVVIYGGNDFSELLKLRHDFHRTDRPKGWGADYKQVNPLRREHPAPFGQALTSALYFRNAPTEFDVTMDEALAVTEELVRHANRRGIRLVFLYLPSAVSSEPELHEEMILPLTEELKLTPAQLGAEDRLGDTLIAGLHEQGADCIDLRPLLDDGQQHYWSRDLHLNLEGHALVAKELLDWYRHPAR